MAIELLGLLAASAGLSYGWWRLQRRREQLLLEAPRDPDLEVVLGVAEHEARSRGHAYLWPLHLLYGLAQDERFVGAIGRLGGDAAKLEAYAQDALDKHTDPHDDTAMHEAAHVLGYAVAAARSLNRPPTCTDLWAQLARTESGDAAATTAGIEPTALLFLLAHDMPEPELELADRTDVHVVLRNDDYTTREFVVVVLRDVFELSDDEATDRMWQTHDQGAAIIGRYKLAVARDKVATVRRRARDAGFPLWIGIEDC